MATCATARRGRWGRLSAALVVLALGLMACSSVPSDGSSGEDPDADGASSSEDPVEDDPGSADPGDDPDDLVADLIADLAGDVSTCAQGVELVACDALARGAPRRLPVAGFGRSCGARLPDREDDRPCSEALAHARTGDRASADACAARDLEACDVLAASRSAPRSLAGFGASCGGRRVGQVGEACASADPEDLASEPTVATEYLAAIRVSHSSDLEACRDAEPPDGLERCGELLEQDLPEEYQDWIQACAGVIEPVPSSCLSIDDAHEMFVAMWLEQLETCQADVAECDAITDSPTAPADIRRYGTTCGGRLDGSSNEEDTPPCRERLAQLVDVLAVVDDTIVRCRDDDCDDFIGEFGTLDTETAELAMVQQAFEAATADCAAGTVDACVFLVDELEDRPDPYDAGNQLLDWVRRQQEGETAGDDQETVDDVAVEESTLCPGARDTFETVATIAVTTLRRQPIVAEETVLGTIDAGVPVDVIAADDSGWFEVEVAGQSGYVFAALLRHDSSSFCVYEAVADDRAQLRTEPGGGDDNLLDRSNESGRYVLVLQGTENAGSAEVLLVDGTRAWIALCEFRHLESGASSACPVETAADTAEETPTTPEEPTPIPTITPTTIPDSPSITPPTAEPVAPPPGPTAEPAAPPPSPTDVGADPPVENSVALSWAYPEGLTGISFVVTAVNVDDLDDRRPEQVGPVRSHTFVGLSPGATYRFEVKARNAAGESAASLPSRPVTIPAIEVPGPPRAVNADPEVGVIRITWATPEGDSNVDSYTIQAYEGSDDGERVLDITTTGTFYDFTSGEGGTLYLFRVRASDDDRVGEFSDFTNAVEFITADPVNVIIQEAEGGEGTGFVRWTEPANVSVQTYRVTITNASGAERTEPTTATSHSFENLDPGDWTVTVTAVLADTTEMTSAEESLTVREPHDDSTPVWIVVLIFFGAGVAVLLALYLCIMGVRVMASEKVSPGSHTLKVPLTVFGTLEIETTGGGFGMLFLGFGLIVVVVVAAVSLV